MARAIKDWEEQNAYTGWRQFYDWRPGRRKAIKRRTHKRERREGRIDAHGSPDSVLDVAGY